MKKKPKKDAKNRIQKTKISLFRERYFIFKKKLGSSRFFGVGGAFQFVSIH